MRTKPNLSLERSYPIKIPRVRFLFYISYNLLKANYVAKSFSEKKKAAKAGTIVKSMISSPQVETFKHIAHIMGYDENSEFTPPVSTHPGHII